MSIIDVTKDSFDEEVLNSEITLVDFNASWCGPCRMLKPILDEIAEETTTCKIVSINIDEEAELATNYHISSIPCLILFKDGKEVKRVVGLRSKEDIMKMLEE